jgi:uncharacterized protein (TIGR02594 family)
MTTYQVTSFALRVREGPGTSTRTIGFLLFHDVVDGLGLNEAGDWVNVQTSKGVIGWCSSKYLQLQEEPTPPPAGGQPTAKYRVTASALNVRHGPGLQYQVIGLLVKDTTVPGYETSPDGYWTQVLLEDGRMGWCSLKYLDMISGTQTSPGNTGSVIDYRVTADALNIRKGPGTHYAVIGYLRRDDLIGGLGLSTDGNWLQVRIANGSTGWCAVSYLIPIEAQNPSPEPGSTMKGMHRVIVSRLNLRSGPGVNYPILGELQNEQTVNVIDSSEFDEWLKIQTAAGLEGWCYYEFLVSLGEMSELQTEEEFPWLPIAFGEFGEREVAGAPSNQRIQEYIMSTSLSEEYPSLPDETDWCAAFVNWAVKKAGVAATESALVYPWTHWGQEVDTPRRGCVVTFSWADGGQHVSFYLGEVDGHVIALGGNQSDAVWISSYQKKFVTSYRISSPNSIPPTSPLPDIEPWKSYKDYDAASNSIPGPKWGEIDSNSWDIERAQLVWEWLGDAHGTWWGGKYPDVKGLTAWLLGEEGSEMFTETPGDDVYNNGGGLIGAKLMIRYMHSLFADGIDQYGLGKFTSFYNPNGGSAFDQGDWNELMKKPANIFINTVDAYWNLDPITQELTWWAPGESGFSQFTKIHTVRHPGVSGSSGDILYFAFK